MDRSLHINDIKGFPGPYVKYINNWFTENNLVSLFSKLTNFDAYWQTSIAYNNHREITVFEGKLHGKITKSPKGRNGWLFDKFFVPEGFKETLAELSNVERDTFWCKCPSWSNFINHLQKETAPDKPHNKQL
jgi:non-canonical purine NTP pyrophosphatase (RdgB/HAM1 family)